MGIRDNLIEFMHDRAVAANEARANWANEHGFEAGSSQDMSITERLIAGLHWLNINVKEGLEELVTPDDRLDSLMKSREPNNTIGADE